MSQANDKPEKQILPETIAPATNLDTVSSQVETIFGIQIKGILESEQLAKVAQLYVDSLQLENDSTTAQIRKTNSEALKNEEEARKLKLDNDDTETSLPRKRFVIRAISVVGAVIAIAGLGMLLRELYTYLTGTGTIVPTTLFTFLVITIVGLLLPLGGRYLLELISLIRK
jgi:hypothetical protein